MTRTIKPSEIKPGMEVEWTQAGVTRKCVPETVDSSSPRYGVNLHTSEGGLVHIPGNAEVTVLAEPQPEEPTEFGARVVANGECAVRAAHGLWWTHDDDCDTWDAYTWDDLLRLGPVTVIPDQGWTVPDGTPEVPEVPDRIEKWPENDEALRSYPWRDRDGGAWKWLTTASAWECYDEEGYYLQSGGRPFYGPWDRVTDA